MRPPCAPPPSPAPDPGYAARVVIAEQALPERLGDFKIVGLLGKGATGTVYEARWGPRVVALKVLRAEHADTPRLRQRFFEEAERFRGLSHPSVVKVLSSGELPDGRPFLALEKLDGETLATRLSRGPLSIDEGVALLRQIGGAVAALHAGGLVHRDIEPGNVFLVAGGQHAVLLEMGMARDAGHPTARTTVGSHDPANTAPERLVGDPASIASDIHELALLFCQATALHDAGRMSKPAEAMLRAALSREPAARPATVAELLGAVCAAAPARRPARPWLRWTLLGAGIAAALAVTLLVMVRLSRSVDDVGRPEFDAAPPSCDDGHAPSCRLLGDRYAFGDGVALDYAAAAEHYRRACEGDDAEGCHMLGRLYKHGEGVHRDTDTALVHYTRACDLSGGTWGCREAGNLIGDPAAAAALYRKACAAADGSGCTNLGLAYARGDGVTEDALEATALWKKACDLEDATGCSNLGLYVRRGVGANKEPERAFDLYARACELSGGASGCANLGELYASGVGVAKDDSRAAELFQQACDKKSAVGCHNLGVAYGAGRGVLKDKGQARSLYRTACELGHAPACNNLGRMLLAGEGGDKDPATGLRYLTQACDGGNALGCSNLAIAHGKDAKAARAARLRACDLGHRPSCDRLGRSPP